MIHQPVIKKVVSGGGSEGWDPSADWPEFDSLIGAGDNAVVLLCAVYDNMPNYIALTPSMSASGGSIDWGDGNTDVVGSSGTKIEHEFSYAGISSDETSCGYKIAVVVIDFAGTLTAIDFDVYHSSETSGIANSALALKICSTYVSPYFTLTSLVRLRRLVYLDVENVYRINGYNLLRAKEGIRSLKINWNSLRNTTQYIFFQCFLTNIVLSGNIDNLAYLGEFLYGSLGYVESVNLSIAMATNLQNFVLNTKNIQKIDLRNTGNVFYLYNTLGSSSGILHFSMDDCHNVTNTSNFLTGTNSLRSLVLTGLRYGIDVSGQNMSADALNAFFTSLGTAAGAQTITITGNPGAATCDTSIATAKGFTVVT